MWLTKDERRVLTGYYHLIGKVNEEVAFELPDLAPILETYARCPRIKEYGADATPCGSGPATVDEMRKEICDVTRSCNRIRHASNLLAVRELITVRDHSHVMDVVVVTLTIAGYDLGRRCASHWDRTGLCFREYKDHWVWLIVGFAGGILGALIVKGVETLLFP